MPAWQVCLSLCAAVFGLLAIVFPRCVGEVLGAIKKEQDKIILPAGKKQNDGWYKVKSLWLVRIAGALVLTGAVLNILGLL
ncbi:MAG: hypothetical protein JXR97_08985 [Planctomycetes bacterium]|nr:hypothetical protein [Planctomycetota bacterium]